MIEGEPQAPPEPKAPPVEGIDRISSDLAEARDQIETVETLVALVRQVKEVSEMHAKLEDVVKSLKHVALTSKDADWSRNANFLLQSLEQKLEQVKANPDRGNVGILRSFLNDEVTPLLEACAKDETERGREAA